MLRTVTHEIHFIHSRTKSGHRRLLPCKTIRGVSQEVETPVGLVRKSGQQPSLRTTSDLSDDLQPNHTVFENKIQAFF